MYTIVVERAPLAQFDKGLVTTRGSHTPYTAYNLHIYTPISALLISSLLYYLCEALTWQA